MTEQVDKISKDTEDLNDRINVYQILNNSRMYFKNIWDI